MNISIFASIGAGNLWDELIVKNQIELLQQEFSKRSQFKVASYDYKNPVFQIPDTRYFEYFPIWIKNLKNIARNIRNFIIFLRTLAWSDIVVIGWGGIIYDSEIQSVKNPLNQWIFRVKFARLLRKKIYFYAVGIDIKQEENFEKLRKIFTKAWKVTVRDQKSQKQLKKIGIKSEIVDDPVMNDNDKRWKILWTFESKDFIIEDFKKFEFSWKKVWLALRSGYFWTRENEKVEELCKYIENTWGKIIFLPHSLHKTDIKANDYECMKQFLNYEREILVDLWEVYTAYNHGLVDIVISMRLHSIVLSYVYGINQIILSYSTKTDELIKKLTK